MTSSDVRNERAIPGLATMNAVIEIKMTSAGRAGMTKIDSGPECERKRTEAELTGTSKACKKRAKKEFR